jgi:amidohydrolase
MDLSPTQIKSLTELRHRLHATPEISGSEDGTAKVVRDFLAKHTSAELIENVGGCGILAIFKSDTDGNTLAFRAELDALPITETSAVKYESTTKGIAHSCGHDGHMAILCGLALRLESEPVNRGKVLLLFQPAEETGEGSARVLSDDRFTSLNPNQIIALHNIPGHDKGVVIWREGVICAASTGMQIELEGMTTHAAHQELGVSPWQALQIIADDAQKLNNTTTEQEDILKITIVGVQMGGPFYGTAPGTGNIWLTLRSFKTSTLKKACKQLESRVSEIAGEHSLKLKITYQESFDATMNESVLTNNFQRWVSEAGMETLEKTEPFSWSEDFGRFTSAYSGFLFGLGAGKDCPPLHASDYDFPDELIQSGVSAFEIYLRNQLK